MKRFSFSSLRFKLIFLVLIAVIPALGITLYSGLEQRRHARLDALDYALELVKKVSHDQEHLIEKTHQLLIALAKMDQVLQCQESGDSPFLASLLKEYPFYTNLGTTRPDGQVICSALPMKQPTNFADREWFPRILHTRKFTASEYLIGRITGKPSIVLSYPILAGTKHLKAVVFASLDLAWLNQIAARAQLPLGSVLWVLDRKGTILARYPDPEKWVGRSMSDTPNVKAILTRQEEGTDEVTGIDGVLRLYAFTPLSNRKEVGAYVSVGIPSTVAFAEANRILFRNLALLVLASLLALAAAWWFGGLFVVGPINRLLNTTKRLADGDLTIRTGLFQRKGEISQLGIAFDQMAESLERREAERKQVEEAAREREAMLRALVETNPESVALIDINGTVLYANRSVASRFGKRPEEFVGKCLYDVLPQEVAAQRRTRVAEVIASGKPVRFLDERGGRFVDNYFYPIVDSGGKVTRLSILGIDLTEHKRAEEMLKESEEYLKNLFDSIRAGIIIIDTETHKIIDVNSFALEIIGVRKEQILNRVCHKYICPAELGKCPITDLKQNVDSSERVLIKDNSERVPILKSVVPVIREGRRYLIESFIDITEHKKAEEALKQTEEQLRQSQRIEAIGRLAGGIAHDFNNLLTVIKGYSQLSLLNLEQSHPLRAGVENIQSAADRASDLTRQLLAFSRRQIMELRVIDLNTVLKNMEKMLMRIIGEDIELVFLLAEDLGRVKTDSGQIDQVLLNLAVNAKDAMPKGGKLTIETANVELDETYARAHVAVTPGCYIMISVSDTGVGMTPEVKERVFEPFFTTKDTGKGTGLGLSTVYGIVKQSGGNIWVYSEPGKGTTFKIYLPEVEEPLKELREELASAEIPHGNETILIVEDDEQVRKLAVQILENYGYTILKASQGNEALSICDEHKGPIHLMVTDVVMPGMDGRELTTCLMANHPELKVLYMSGYTDNAIVHHGVLEKGMNYIQKPFTVEGLARKVREVLDK